MDTGGAGDLWGFRALPAQGVKAGAMFTNRRPIGVDMVAVAAQPLRPPRRRQGPRQPGLGHRIVSALAFLNRRHQRQHPRIRRPFHQISQRAARLGEIFGDDMQLGHDQPGFVILWLQPRQLVKTFHPLRRRLFWLNLGKDMGKVRVRLCLPGLFQHLDCIAFLALRQIGSRRHRRCRNQIGR